MKTLEEIKARCEIFNHEHGSKKEHWVWLGCRDGRDRLCVCRAPDYGRDPSGKHEITMSVRKAIHMVTKKTGVRKDYRFFQTCLVDGCVSPDCTSLTTKKRGGVHVSRRMRADPKTQANLSAAALRIWDKRGRKVSDEQIEEIILSDKSNKEIAAELGIDPATAWEYRTGRSRRDANRQALGIFSGLLR